MQKSLANMQKLNVSGKNWFHRGGFVIQGRNSECTNCKASEEFLITDSVKNVNLRIRRVKTALVAAKQRCTGVLM